ncbi:hypothetical protein [Butyrivibrio sp. WCD3002]|uniref:hypothetical protein n=1 Tax=Butyrivibrio sp. WCD3002 TaxID=1280676 RepID=UPI0004057D50|nr:hypothetical protein [Butyrivibrio sp. WCD3002]
MNGGIAMEVVRTTLDADLLSPIISIPFSLKGKKVDVTITEAKKSIVDELYGIASNLDMSLDEIRTERLQSR